MSPDRPATPAAPVLSVITIIASDTIDRADAALLEPCLAALHQQAGAPALEIIVPHPPAVAGIEGARRRFPDVRFLEIHDLHTWGATGGTREHHDELRARGLAVARGDIVALTEDHAIPAPDWCAQLVEAHRLPYAGVGGAIENGIDRPLNWAVYFCDFLRYQRPLRTGESSIASDVNVAYKRAALERIRPVWKESYSETLVNRAIQFGGGKLALAPTAVVHQQRRGLRLGMALQERFVWGRSFGATRARMAGKPRRFYWLVFSPLLPPLLLARMAFLALKKRRTLRAFVTALPLTAALVVSWCWGEFTGYLTGRPHGSGAAGSVGQALAEHSQISC